MSKKGQWLMIKLLINEALPRRVVAGLVSLLECYSGHSLCLGVLRWKESSRWMEPSTNLETVELPKVRRLVAEGA